MKAMELGEVLRTLSQRRLAVLAVLAISVAVGVLAAYKPVGFSLEPRTASAGVATKQILVESPRSPLTDLRGDSAPQNDRTGGFSQVLASPELLKGIERKTGIPASEITSEGPFVEPSNVQSIVRPAEARGLEIVDETKDYRLRFITPVNLPIVSIHANGPNAEEAARLADGAFAALRAYLKPLENEIHPAPTYPVWLRDLGPAQAGTSGGGMGKAVFVLGFCATMMLGLLLILIVEVARRGLRVPPRPLPVGSALAGPRSRGAHARGRG
jgi:hypothetical protein